MALGFSPIRLWRSATHPGLFSPAIAKKNHLLLSQQGVLAGGSQELKRALGHRCGMPQLVEGHSLSMVPWKAETAHRMECLRVQKQACSLRSWGQRGTLQTPVWENEARPGHGTYKVDVS